MRYTLLTILVILFFAAPIVAQETTVIPLKIEAKKESKTAPPAVYIIQK